MTLTAEHILYVPAFRQQAERCGKLRAPDLARDLIGSALKYLGKVCVALHAGLRGMAATRAVASGETLVSLPVSAALVVAPKARCALPSSFCSAKFFSGKPWCALMNGQTSTRLDIFYTAMNRPFWGHLEALTPFTTCMPETMAS